MECSFNDLPLNVTAEGSFEDDCAVVLTKESITALEAGRLKIAIRHMGGRRSLKGIRPYVGAIRGNLKISIGDNDAEIVFGAKTSGNFTLTLWRRCRVHIGEGTTSNGTRIFCADSEFRCGPDCMFSDDVLIQTSDQHGLVDLDSGDFFNTHYRTVILEEHVWLGRSCVLTPDVMIGKGSVVGTGAVVTGEVPRFVIVAGVPARVLKENTSWSRTIDRMDQKAKEYVRTRRRAQGSHRHDDS